MSTGSGTIKEVISGDTVKILGKLLEDGPPPEITITLASVIAPRLKGGVAEENFAWESKEFLRELCIGKRVNFRITQVVNTINRTFGEVFLCTDASNQVNLQLAAVEAGWVTVKIVGGAAISDADPNYYLVEAEQKAKLAKIGIHAGNPPIRPPMNTSPTPKEIDALYRKYCGKPTPALIEYVRDGGSLRVLLLDCWTFLSVSITGIVCPRFNSSGPAGSASQVGPDPFAEQSRLFTQMRLLNRKLMINIEGIESSGSGVFATILHPKGNVAVDIIRAGLAKCFDRSLGLLPKETVQHMRRCESEAKEEKRCLWEEFVATAPSMVKRQYEAVCIEVVSGDTIVVVEGDLSTGEERRITIAGVRVPRLGTPSGAPGVKSAGEPWGVECRDALVAALVGKKVSVTEEYTRATSASRVFASVTAMLPVSRGKFEEGDVAEYLLQQGLCWCVRYKAGSDEERVQAYDMLLIAENKAQTAGKGLHGTAAPPSSSALAVNDMSSDIRKAKQYLALLQGASKGVAYSGPATVEYVFGGSRFKVMLPYPENCCMQFSLAEVRCPLMGRSAPSKTPSSGSSNAPAARTAEPFSDEARAFSRRRLTQRTVTLEITDMDKNGIALGKLFFADGTDAKKSLSHALVEEGLAKVDKYVASRAGQSMELLLEAEAECKAAGKGVWSIPEVEVVAKPAAAEVLGSKTGQVVKVRLSEIVNGCSFYVHVLDESGDYPTGTTQKVEQMMVEFEEGVRPEAQEGPLKKGQLCVSRYSGEPGKWFRAKVIELLEGEAKVLFIDYGNVDVVSVSDIVSCTASSFVFELPAQAIECYLAFLFVHPVEDDSSGLGREAALYLNDLVWDKDMLLQVVGSPEATGAPVPVALYEVGPNGGLTLDHTKGSGEDIVHSVNEEMIIQGLARISRTSTKKVYGGPEKTTLLNRLRDAQSSAIRSHVNMFRYGDPGDSDDEKMKL